jgi:Leucine-rich repeat (LRR) protein
MCQAVGVHAMSMSGLGSSSHCHNIVKVPFTSVSLVQTMDGSIPNCVWLLSNLKSLDLAGNGLSGTIGEMAAMSSLASLTLSHNYLTGVIPTWLQEKELNQLDLSHNKLTGALDDFKQKNDQEITSLKSLKLSVNRLSGNLFRSLGRYSTLDILSGNLFSCGYIPTNDKNSAWTICGSEELDQSLMVMGGVCFVILLLLCFYGFCLFFFTLFFKNSTTTTLHQTHGNLEITADNTQQPLGKVFLWFQGRFFDSQTLILYTNYFSLDSLPILNHQTCASIVSFGLFLSNFNRSLCLLTLLSLFLSLPIYLLKVIDVESQDGDETNDNQTQYITHTHMYRWLWTMTFISGALPSILLLTVTLLCLMTFCFIINLFGKSMSIKDITHQDEAVRSSNSCSSTPLPLSQSQTNEEDIKLEDDNKQGQGHVGFHMSAAVWLVLMINITVVGAVNGLYLWSTLLDLSNHVRILIQFSFGLFTLAWRVLIINRGLPSQMKESCHGVWLLTCLNVVNNVLIPCVVTALSNPSCYQVSISISMISSTHPLLALEIACSSR